VPYQGRRCGAVWPPGNEFFHGNSVWRCGRNPMIANGASTSAVFLGPLLGSTAVVPGRQ